MSDTYTASDGSLWHIEFVYPPIPSRHADWAATHDDYDPTPEHSYGPPGDDRAVTAPTRAALLAEIEEFVADE